MNYAGKKALVLGLGESGLAMARWLACCGASVRVADTREQPQRLAVWQKEQPGAEFCHGAFSAALVDGMDMVAVSPGLAPATDLAEICPAARERGIPVWSEIELFAQALALLRQERGYCPKVIAITGTNGKTTTTSLTGRMCAQAGKTVKVAGNISPAVLDVLRESLKAGALPEVWVLELSSFQLWHTWSLNADAAAVLNVTQDHLDWHGDMDAYAAAKARIFGKKTVRLLNRDDARVMAMAGASDVQATTFGLDAPRLPGDLGVHRSHGMDWLCVAGADGYEDLMPAASLHIRGRHNASNALAALGLCRAAGLPMAPLLAALQAYRGEPHRVEMVRSVAGVSYIDDSKGTNVGATVAAVEGLGAEKAGRSLLLIAGGDGKNQDFSPLAPAVSRYVHTVFLIGKDAEAIRRALKESGAELVSCGSLEEAVRRAADKAGEGETVLLSPACASWDMFKNYAHRSEVFVSAVRDVALSRGEAA